MGDDGGTLAGYRLGVVSPADGAEPAVRTGSYPIAILTPTRRHPTRLVQPGPTVALECCCADQDGYLDHLLDRAKHVAHIASQLPLG